MVSLLDHENLFLFIGQQVMLFLTCEMNFHDLILRNLEPILEQILTFRAPFFFAQYDFEIQTLGPLEQAKKLEVQKLSTLASNLLYRDLLLHMELHQIFKLYQNHFKQDLLILLVSHSTFYEFYLHSQIPKGYRAKFTFDSSQLTQISRRSLDFYLTAISLKATIIIKLILALFCQ